MIYYRTEKREITEILSKMSWDSDWSRKIFGEIEFARDSEVGMKCITLHDFLLRLFFEKLRYDLLFFSKSLIGCEPCVK